MSNNLSAAIRDNKEFLNSVIQYKNTKKVTWAKAARHFGYGHIHGNSFGTLVMKEAKKVFKDEMPAVCVGRHKRRGLRGPYKKNDIRRVPKTVDDLKEMYRARHTPTTTEPSEQFTAAELETLRKYWQLTK